MEYTKGNIGASGIWEASGNSEVIGIKDAVTLTPICFIKPANWNIAHLIAAAPEMYEALKHLREDINWMLNEQKFLNPDVFNYLDRALAKAEGDK